MAAVTDTSWPCPDRLAVCGLLLASSVTVSVALREPDALGENVTSIVQLEFAASELPQVLVCEKYPLSAPVTATLVMFTALLPEFVSVAVFAMLESPTLTFPKSSEFGARLTVPEGVTTPPIFATNASEFPAKWACSAPATGKSADIVVPDR